MAGSPRIGIIALHGAVEPHREKLLRLHAEPVSVVLPDDLSGLQGVILPGGESTTMLHLLRVNRLWFPLKEFISTHPAWGVCAGAILMAKRVHSPAQASFESMDMEVVRNAYGRQIDSFIACLDPAPNWYAGDRLEGVFIRAPRIIRVGDSCRVLLRYNAEIALAEENDLLASTFHPELTDSLCVHRYFLEKCARA